MSRVLRFDFPALPVSVNRLYTHAHGRKILTAAGRRYRDSFVSSGGGVPKGKLIAFQADQESPYIAYLWFLLPRADLYNEGYGKSKSVKSPFRDVDVDNMVKLSVDCMAALLGIRDRNNFTVVANKREAVDGLARTVAVVEPLDLAQDPFPIPE